MQERSVDRTKVQKPIVIEVAGEPLGVVVAHAEGYRFLAVKLPAFAIDGQTYDSVENARIAASEVMRLRGLDAA
ncbi:hypothetical protein [Devosia sp.]|uniref:hypothetical protein n=1 Tax=Devosia sp. TaxID=1871048 RepID=UPI0032646D52